MRRSNIGYGTVVTWLILVGGLVHIIGCFTGPAERSLAQEAQQPGQAPGGQRGKTYYIDPVNGSDSHDGLASATEGAHGPWQHLRHAGGVVRPGDTVRLRGGTYKDDYFWPVNSGAQGAPITVAAYPGETPVLTGAGYYGAFIYIGWSGKHYFILDGLHFENTTAEHVVRIENGTHNVVRNCHFRKHEGTMMCVILGGYNLIEKNRFDTTGGDLSGAGAGDHIYVMGTDRNLVQDNYFTKAGHAAIDLMDYLSKDFCDYNVIRNNTIEQHWGSGIGLILGTTHTLVENNRVFYAGEEVTNYPKGGILIVSESNIVRGNIVARTSARPFRDNAITFEAHVFQGRHQHCVNNAVYNNVIYKAGKEALFVTQRQDCRLTRNKFLNNIVYHNRVGGPEEKWIPHGNHYLIFETYHAAAENKWATFPNDNYFHHNVLLHADQNGDHPGEAPFIYYGQEGWGHSLAWVESRYPTHFYSNVERNPLFVDAERGDFRLRPGSPAIDAGDFLTRTVASGSNATTIRVHDASFFCDGFGIVEGDQVHVGSNPPVRITKVDYETNTLVVSSPVSFRSGDLVALRYAGKAPDIGAHEFE